MKLSDMKNIDRLNTLEGVHGFVFCFFFSSTVLSLMDTRKTHPRRAARSVFFSFFLFFSIVFCIYFIKFFCFLFHYSG